MIREYMALSCLVLMASGCATYATGPLFKQAPIPPGKKSLVYVFHEKSPLVYTPTVKINGEPFVKLTKLGYSYAYLSPGIYRLTFQYGGFEGAFITEIEIKEGRQIFLKYFSSGFDISLKEVPETEALNEIKEYKYVEPFRTEFDS